MRLFNTLSRKIEKFQPLNPPHVGIYICGPTVYDYAHIGHSRTYVNSDILVRTLKWLGFEVKAVINITDVGHLTSQGDTGEDKVEKKARLEKKSAQEIAKFYTDDFWQMVKLLNILQPDVVCSATKHIQEMIALVKQLEQKGFTYRTSDGIYFDTAKFPHYGRLARINLKGLKEGWRVEKNPEKKNPSDFALWKFSPPAGGEQRQMEWSSPWGIGFPGWHIECSAMSMKYLGESFEIHTGGVDHIPIHHTNEIAQAEAVTGKQFVTYWFHSNFLMVNGEKMSKSLGNFLRVEDLIKKSYDPLALRYLFLTGHYRTKMNFTFKALAAAGEAYKKLKAIINTWQKTDSLQGENLKFSQRFKAAVEGDLGMPQALAVVWEMAKSNIPSGDKYELISDWDRVLGLDLTKSSNAKMQIPNQVQMLIKEREKLRKAEKWKEADEIRKQLEKKGYLLEDTQKGTIVRHD